MGFVDAARAFGGLVHPLHYAKAWYFVSFAAYACLTPYLPLFYERWGLTSTEIGYVNALRPLVGFVATPAWGYVADVTGKHNAIFFWKTVCQGAGYAALGWFVPKKFAVIFAYVFVLEGTCAATMTLADAATGTMCKRAAARGETPAFGTTYGEIRLWGAISWGFVFGPLMGALLTYLPPDQATKAPFVAYPVFLAMSAVTTLGFDFSPIAEEKDREIIDEDVLSSENLSDGATFAVSASTATIDVHDEHDSTEVFRRRSVDETVERGHSRTSLKKKEQDKQASRSVARQTWRAVSRPKSAATFLAFLVMSASMAVTDTYLFLWMEQLGASRLCMGVALGFTCLSEVVVFKKEAAIKNAISTEQSIALILFCYAARQWFYAALPFLTRATPLGAWIILPAQLLHGITFGLFWSVGTAFARQIAPTNALSAVMGVFGGANAGGSFLGSALGGVVYRKRGGDGLFAGIGSMNFLLGCLACVALVRNTTNTKNTPGEVRHETQTRRSFFATFFESFRAKKTFFFANRRGAGWRPVAADEVEMRGEI
jgi:MFS family permease